MSAAAKVPPADPVPSLPIVRVFPAYAAPQFLGPDDDVLALYDRAIVVFTKPHRASIPPEAHLQDGEPSILETPSRGPMHTIAWGDVEAICATTAVLRGSNITNNKQLGHEIRIHLCDGTILPLFLPASHAQNVFAALQSRLGARFEGGLCHIAPLDTPPPPSRFYTMLGLVPVLPFLLMPAFILASFALESLRAPGTATRTGQGPTPSMTGALARLLPRSLGISLAAAIATLVLLPFSFISHPYLFFPIIVLGPSFLGALLSQKFIAPYFHLYATRIIKVATPTPPPKLRVSHRTPRTTPGRRPLHSTPVSLLLKGIGCAILIFTYPLQCYLSSFLLPSQVTVSVFGLAISLLLYFASVFLIYYGYRLGLKPADSLLRRDKRPPVVYLRSFSDDGHFDFNPKGFVPFLLGIDVLDFLQKLVGPLANFHPLRLARLCFSTTQDTAEEQLARFLRKRGPFIAIGRPGDAIAQGGAARAYVPDENWQDRVSEWIGRAQMIVLQPSETDSVFWEIETVLNRVPLERVLFCLIHFKSEPDAYERFAARFQSQTGLTIPQAISDQAFLWFSEGKAQLAPMRLRHPIFWPFGCAANFSATLAPFFSNMKGHPLPIRQARPGRLRRAFDIGLALSFWLPIICVANMIPAALGAGLFGISSHEYGIHELRISRLISDPSQQEIMLHADPNGLFTLRLKRFWVEFPSPQNGDRLFTLGDIAALMCRTGAVDPLSTPQFSTLEDRSGSLVQALSSRLDGHSEILTRRRFAGSGLEWCETVFNVWGVGGGHDCFRCYHRVTHLGGREIELSCLIPVIMSPNLDPVVLEAMDGFVHAVEAPTVAPQSDVK